MFNRKPKTITSIFNNAVSEATKISKAQEESRDSLIEEQKVRTEKYEAKQASIKAKADAALKASKADHDVDSTTNEKSVVEASKEIALAERLIGKYSEFFGINETSDS